MDLTGRKWRTISYSGSNGGNCVELTVVSNAGDADT